MLLRMDQTSRRARPPLAAPSFALGPSRFRLGSAGLIRLMTPPATADHVTGLPGRSSLLDRASRALASGPAALVVVRLNRLSEINDTLGHAIGDSMLALAAARLQETVRQPDLVGTMGGAGFALLVPGIATTMAAEALADRLVDRLSRPYQIGDVLAATGAAAGFVLAPRDGLVPADLLRRAGLALEVARQGQGLPRAAGFRPAQEDDARRRLATESALRRALPLEEFELHYQPQIGMESGRILGFEALIRWRRDGVLIPPDGFLPTAESSGLILPIGAWAFRQACRTAAGWARPVTIAVNVAAHQFADGRLPAEVASALAASGLPPERLELEITESALLRHGAHTLEQLRALRAMRVRIAMDDFGTGYASLSQLHAFPFDRLKIDRSFVAEVEHGGSGATIVTAIAELGAQMGLETVAEGVESQSQLEALRRRGCAAAQGYLLGRPGPADQLAALLAA